MVEQVVSGNFGLLAFTSLLQSRQPPRCSKGLARQVRSRSTPLRSCRMPPSLISDISEGASGLDSNGSTRAFRTCKWCRRPSHTPNPLVYKRERQPLIAWRRTLGRECGNCQWLIEGDEELSQVPKLELENKLKDDDEHHKFMKKLNAWEELKNSTAGGKVIKTKLNAKTQVGARNSACFQTRKFFGILWPIALYTKHFGKKPKKSSIGSYPVNGQMVRGVLLLRSQGEVPGTIELYSVSEQGTDMTAVVASNEDLNDSDVERAFVTAQKRQRLTPQTKAGKDGEQPCIVLKGGRVDEYDDSSGDDAILDSIWGNRLKNMASDSEGGAGEGGQGTRRRKGNAKDKPAASAKVVALSSPGKMLPINLQ